MLNPSIFHVFDDFFIAKNYTSVCLLFFVTSIDDRALGYACKDNKYDKAQYCKCRPGERVSYFHSVHENWAEDRVWTLKCEAIQSDRPFPLDTDLIKSHENGFDEAHFWFGYPQNSFLVGMESEHENWAEDRKYTFFHTQSEHWTLANCESEWVNKFDEEVHVDMSDSNKVIAGNQFFEKNSHFVFW